MKKLGEKYDMPIWFYYQGQNLHDAPFFIFPMVRAMMFAGVLYGAKGLQHYTACGAIITQEGERDIFFDDQKKIHEEFKNLGETLMALTCKRVIHDETVDPNCEMYEELHSKEADSDYLASKLPARISVSEFEDEYGNGYMMVLNRDYMTNVDISLDLKGKYRVYEVSKIDGTQNKIFDSVDKLELKLEAGDARLVRIQKADEEEFIIEYRLSK
jgi:hypothetical protein